MESEKNQDYVYCNQNRGVRVGMYLECYSDSVFFFKRVQAAGAVCPGSGDRMLGAVREFDQFCYRH